MEILIELGVRLKYKVFNQKALFDQTVAKTKTLEKRWLLDVDFKDKDKIKEIINIIDICDPMDQDKIITFIPTKNGVHIITNKFNIEQFNQLNKYSIDIHKTNPTLLYYPNSLENDIITY